jgi:hypothetical protein
MNADKLLIASCSSILLTNCFFNFEVLNFFLQVSINKYKLTVLEKVLLIKKLLIST